MTEYFFPQQLCVLLSCAICCYIAWLKTLSKKNNVLLHKFLTTLHLVVSGRPSASPSGPVLYLLDKHRWKRKNSFYWTNLLAGWGNERFKSVQIVRSTSRKIREMLQTFITNNPPDAHYNLSASSVNSSQVPFIKILTWLTLRKPKKNKWEKPLSQTPMCDFPYCLNAWVFVIQFCLCPLRVNQIMFGQAGTLPDRQFIQTYLFSSWKKLSLDGHQLCMLLALRVSGQALVCFPTTDPARDTTWPLVKRLICNVMRFFRYPFKGSVP